MKKDDILDLENRLRKAMTDGDIVLLKELLHDDLLFVIPSGDVITKEMDLQSYRDGRLQVLELNPEIENLHIIGEVAVITILMKMKASYDGEQFEGLYRYIRFWKSFSTGIKVIGGSGMIVNT